MNRGSDPRPNKHRGTLAAFNEAPIHESGKYRPLAEAPAAGSARFNEAPIHESGKSGGVPQSEGDINWLQ